MGDAEVAFFGPQPDIGGLGVFFGHEIKRGGDATHGGLDTGRLGTSAEFGETLEADHEAGNESPHRSLVATRFFGELGDEFAYDRAEERIALRGDEVAEAGAAKSAAGEEAGLGPHHGNEAGRVEIDPGPTAGGAGNALREMDLGGGDDGDISGAEREDFAADDEGTGALVAVAEFDAVVAVEPGDGAVALLIMRGDGNGEILGQSDRRVFDLVGPGWSFLHSFCILMRRHSHPQP